MSNELELIMARCQSYIGDLYKNIAAEYYNVPFDEVTFEQKREIKAAVFIYLYGGNKK